MQSAAPPPPPVLHTPLLGVRLSTALRPPAPSAAPPSPPPPSALINGRRGIRARLGLKGAGGGGVTSICSAAVRGLGGGRGVLRSERFRCAHLRARFVAHAVLLACSFVRAQFGVRPLGGRAHSAARSAPGGAHRLLGAVSPLRPPRSAGGARGGGALTQRRHRGALPVSAAEVT